MLIDISSDRACLPLGSLERRSMKPRRYDPRLHDRRDTYVTRRGLGGAPAREEEARQDIVTETTALSTEWLRQHVNLTYRSCLTAKK